MMVPKLYAASFRPFALNDSLATISKIFHFDPRHAATWYEAGWPDPSARSFDRFQIGPSIACFHVECAFGEENANSFVQI